MKPDIEDPFKDLVPTECDSCTRYMLVGSEWNFKPECQNCYITKLELLKKEEDEQDKFREARVFRLKRG